MIKKMNIKWENEKKIAWQAGCLPVTRREEGYNDELFIFLTGLTCRNRSNEVEPRPSKSNVKQANNFYPSGTSIAELPRRTDQGVQPYKLQGKELDRSYGLDFYDFEARAFDPVLMRFTRTDPMAEKYPGISPYAFCMNNPVRYTDPTGKWIVGTDGRPVVYSKEIGWSRNASNDVKRVGNALLKTENGQKRLNAMFYHDEKISISLSSDIISEGNNSYRLGDDKKTNIKQSSDGNITVGEHKIIIYDEAIKGRISETAGDNPYKGLTMDEAIGVVAGHESGHTEHENTKQAVENRQNGTNHDVEAQPDKIENKILEEIRNKKNNQ